MSTPSAGAHPPQLMVDTHQGATPTPGATAGTPSHGSVNMMNTTPRLHHEQNPAAYRSPPLSATGQRQVGPSGMQYSHFSFTSSSQLAQGHIGNGPHNQSTTLPPFSSISGVDSMGPPRSQPANVSSVRYHTSGSKRAAPTSSNVTSADSTDAEEDDGELPASGLVAPWEVLRGLADVAIERAAQVTPSLLLFSAYILMKTALGKWHGERASKPGPNFVSRSEAVTSHEAQEGAAQVPALYDIPRW